MDNILPFPVSASEVEQRIAARKFVERFCNKSVWAPLVEAPFLDFDEALAELSSLGEPR